MVADGVNYGLTINDIKCPDEQLQSDRNRFKAFIINHKKVDSYCIAVRKCPLIYQADGNGFDTSIYPHEIVDSVDEAEQKLFDKLLEFCRKYAPEEVVKIGLGDSAPSR